MTDEQAQQLADAIVAVEYGELMLEEILARVTWAPLAPDSDCVYRRV